MLSNSRWRERWCRVKDNKLIFHKDRTDLKTHIVSIPLRGCDVIPGLDSRHPLTFRLLRNGQEVAVLEVRCCPRPHSDILPRATVASGCGLRAHRGGLCRPFLSTPPCAGARSYHTVQAALRRPTTWLPFLCVPLCGEEIGDPIQRTAF